MIAFGPVPSRRLGHSLGINNIPPKTCTYSCIYCQLGKTSHMRFKRQAFYSLDNIIEDVRTKVKEAKNKRELIDYMAFVADGEPTLDSNIGEAIALLKPMGIKIAVITNASLIGENNVRDSLSKADWISVKIDAISEKAWCKINRPNKSMHIGRILQGIIEFSKIFSGILVTETMLIQDVNDDFDELNKISHFIAELHPAKSYISIPTRPPAEKWVMPAAENTLNTVYWLFKDNAVEVEYLINYEGNDFAFTGNGEEDLLRITSVHPMREDAIKEFLHKAETDWSMIEKLIHENKLVEIKYKNKKFYLRNLNGTKKLKIKRSNYANL